MVSKQQIQNIKTNIERTIQGLSTKPQEFVYSHTKGLVKPGTMYSVYFTLSKKEVYLTGITDTSNSKLILRNRIKDRTLFDKYVRLKFPKRQKYPKVISVNPSKSDYRIRSIMRYFTQKGNNRNADIFEVSKADFSSKNNLYRYTSFQWRISGKKEEVTRDNQRTMRRLEKGYPGISKLLFPLQLWIPSKDSSESLQKKLLLLKTY